MRLNWQLRLGALSKENCEAIIESCLQNCTLGDATTFGGDSSGNRKTRVGWTQDPVIMNIIKSFALESNRSAFNLDASYLPPVQFGEYGEGGHYDWHHDVNWENPGYSDRKISVVLQLSDPESYSGGDFQFREVETPRGFRQQGSLLAFPSYLLHRVTPVTSGTRYSLVGWMEGPKWK